MAKVEKTIKALVAANRTVKFEGKNVGPGGEVTLPTDEVDHLRKLGYLVSPGVEAVAVAPGPAFEKDVEGPASGGE